MLDETANLILNWLRKIGLGVRLVPIAAETFLPGVALEANGLVVDPEKLKYSGDLLHEAGHLAVLLPEDRARCTANAGADLGYEIAAQTWSYAAAIHLGLSPEVVFHGDGYKGSADKLIEIYGSGSAGVPLLQWMGLTWSTSQADSRRVEPYPRMIRWLRIDPDDLEAES